MTGVVSQLALPLGAGAALGAANYAALWFTVRGLASTRRPALLSLLSFWGRTAIVLAGFYLASGGRWEGLLASLAGFLLVRVAVTRRALPGGRRTGL